MKEKSTSKDLYVADIAFETEEEELHKLFSLCGTVRSIHMITDPKSGQFKGCAFVHMANAAEARDAVTTLDGVALHKRSLSVTIALPRKPAAAGSKATRTRPAATKRTPGRRK